MNAKRLRELLAAVPDDSEIELYAGGGHFEIGRVLKEDERFDYWLIVAANSKTNREINSPERWEELMRQWGLAK